MDLQYEQCYLFYEVNCFVCFVAKISSPFLTSSTNFLYFLFKTELHFPDPQEALTHFIEYYHPRGMNSLLRKIIEIRKEKYC